LLGDVNNRCNAAVRIGGWKLATKDGGVWKLYNMRNDRAELIDLSEQENDRCEKMIGTQ
jgi:hypothetical protein